MTLPLQPNLLGLPLAPAQCVVDSTKELFVQQKIIDAARENCLNDSTVLPNYLDAYRLWINSTTLNSVTGLDQYPVAAITAGTSESFDKFYLKHNGSRFRCFQGEYLYHRLSWQHQRVTWRYLGDEPIRSGDAVVISLPFADTGDMHPLYNKQLLDQCQALNVPVLLDCAFFGICANIDFDFLHPAITDVCFSLSKTFPVSTLRIGIRFTRQDDGDSLLIYNNTQYINRFAASVGLKLLKSQSPDEIYQRYAKQQHIWCHTHNLVPSNTVIFGIDHEHQFDQYNRGMEHTNRLCFSKYFESGVLPENVKL